MGLHKKHKIQATTMLAFSEILPILGERQMLTFQAIKKIQPCSNMELSKYLGLPINTITPRCQELRKMKLVTYYKKDKCKYTNKLVMYWVIPSWINQVML